jgi:hypothetical protein
MQLFQCLLLLVGPARIGLCCNELINRDLHVLQAAEICLEKDLPGKRDDIGIKDFRIGLFTTDPSGLTKVVGYESRKLPTASPASLKPKKVKVVSAAEFDAEIEDVIKVEGERYFGCYGAPYFNISGKVVAFHVRSIDDSDTMAASKYGLCFMSLDTLLGMVHNQYKGGTRCKW